MTYSIRLTLRALEEIDDAFRWLANQSPMAADRWLDGLTKALRSLEHMPQVCSLAPEDEWYPTSLRQLIYGKRRGAYRILFEIRDDVVNVIRVLHGARKLLLPGEI